MSLNEMLISAVYKRAPIWNTNDMFHKDRIAVLACWDEISSELRLDRDTVKQKWKSLRDYYRSELKRTEKFSSPDYSGPAKESRWPYFNMMSFLKLTKERRFSASIKLNLDDADIADDVSRPFSPDEGAQNDADDDDETDETDNMSPSVRKEDNPLPRGDAPSSSRYQSVHHWRPTQRHDEMAYYVKKTLEIKSKKLKLIEKEKLDEDLMFFKSLLPDLKTLPRSKKMFLKLKFQELLYNEIKLAEMPTSRTSEPRAHASSSHQPPNAGMIVPKVEMIT